VGVRVAALYDVHANLPALEAVLEEVERERPDVVLFGGDVIWGAWPRETLELALSLGGRARFVMGNTDRKVLVPGGKSRTWVRKRLKKRQRALVAGWPALARLDVDGLGPTLFCHATPRRDDEVVLPGWEGSPWSGALAGVDERVVVCGHTHVQFDIEIEGHRVVNPGSVGNPTVRPAAWWALLGPDVELRATEYDSVGTAAAWRETGFPRTDFADELLDPYPVERVLADLDALAP